MHCDKTIFKGETPNFQKQDKIEPLQVVSHYKATSIPLCKVNVKYNLSYVIYTLKKTKTLHLNF